MAMLPADGESDTDLASWLQESGRRRAVPREPAGPAAVAAQDLLRLLERLTGQPLTTEAEVRAFAAAHRPPPSQAVRIAREAGLLAVLVLAYLQYYFVDVQTQINALRGVMVFVGLETP